jgi:cytochrome P450
MAQRSRGALLQEGLDHPERAEMSETGPSGAQRFAERFDPFHDPYLADPYPFFAEARAATPVFYSPDLDYWVVTRYRDIEHIFQTPKVFSAANTLAHRCSRSAPPQDASWQRAAFGRSQR